MLDLIANTGKVLLLGFWVAWIASLASLVPDPLRPYVVWTGVVLLLVHLSEYVAVRSRLTQTDGNHFVRTLLFGFGHWLPLLRKGKREA
jgi:uncharacterized protein YhhL (DUF1145 family)